MESEDFNFGFLADLVGDYFREEPEGYTGGVELLEAWLHAEKENAHLEALAGVVGQLLLREDFMDQTGSWSPDFVKGYREGRYKVQHVLGTLSASYKNRRRFAERDRLKEQTSE
jgi:hypothetical protein